MDALDDFLHRANYRQLTPSGEPATLDVWVPDIHSLAKIAACIHDQESSPRSYHQILRRAWVWLVEAQMFRLELVNSPPERWLDLYRSERSASATVEFGIWLRQSTAQPHYLQLEPSKSEKDEVREFFDVKTVESVFQKLRVYCEGRGVEGDGDGIYTRVLDAARREIEGRTCFEFPADLLEAVKGAQSVRKQRGGRKGYNRTPEPEAAEKIIAEED